MVRMLKQRVSPMANRAPRVHTVADRRITGRPLQARRLRLWSASPHCAHCGRMTMYPQGFELDHVVALTNGGEDTDENCQVLCTGDDGCHRRKTASDMGRDHSL